MGCVQLNLSAALPHLKSAAHAAVSASPMALLNGVQLPAFVCARARVHEFVFVCACAC